jgi:glycosyltransferase 2 family protein
MRDRVWPIVRVGFGLAGLVFLALVLARAIDRLGAEVLPSWPHIVVAAALAEFSLILGARAWSSLFEGGADGLRRSYYASQLGKYIPGGIWQMVALVESGARSGAGFVRSSIRFPVYVLTTIAAGGSIGAGLALAGAHASARVRIASLAGLLTLALIDRRLIAFVLKTLARVTRRQLPGDPVPSQGAIITSYVYGLGAVLATAGAYAALLASLPTRVSSFEAVTAFALAWTAGFVAIPIPSGVGIREAVLVGVTASGFAGPVVAAAVVQRVVVIIAELVMVLSLALRKRARVA